MALLSALLSKHCHTRKAKRPQKIQAGQGDWQGHDIIEIDDRDERMSAHELKGRIEQAMVDE